MWKVSECQTSLAYPTESLSYIRNWREDFSKRYLKSGRVGIGVWFLIVLEQRDCKKIEEP